MALIVLAMLAGLLLASGAGLVLFAGFELSGAAPATVVFAVLAIGLIAASLGVVLARHPIRSALSLVVAMFLLAAMFATLDAQLIAALQIIVYAGAIMVLFLFVIMLLNLQAEPGFSVGVRHLGVGAAAGVLFLLAVGRFFLGDAGATAAAGPGGPGMGAPVPADFGGIVPIGERLFTHFLLAFEVTSILLLVAVVGSIVLAKRNLV
ncbi:NADH-quinone oxidoreductase subunit J [Candidatus Binatia bacterium]|nr:NADH-quinone oxidoreductase subunit J [Candidatus Binatia bacterium]